jgi:hypothetical protein
LADAQARSSAVTNPPIGAPGDVEHVTTPSAPHVDDPARQHWAPLAWSVGALCIVLVVVGALIDATGVVTSDESIYSIQARAIGEGSWELGYAAGDLDAAGEWFPLAQVERGDNGFFAYTRQPLYVVVLGAAWSAFGDLGLHLVSLASLVVACAAASALASLRGRRAATWAFWIAACSPLFVNAWMVSGHVPVAAMSGLSVLVALWTVCRPDRGPTIAALVAAGCLAAVASMLRADGIFVAIAVAAMVVVARWSTGAIRALGWSTVVILPTLVALVAQRLWVLEITGGDVAATFDRTAGTGIVAGRIEGAWHSLLEPGLPPMPNEGALTALGLAAVLLAGAAGWRMGSRPAHLRDGTVMLVLAAGCVALRALLGPGELISGLLAAWPVLAFLVAGLATRHVSHGPARLLVVYSAVVAGGVLATQYADGGSVQWGGRFFSAIVVPGAVLLAWFLVDTGAAVRRSSAVAFAAVLVVPVVAGSVAVARHHDDNRALVEAIETLPPTTIVTDRGRTALLALGAGRTGWLLVEDGDVSDVARLVADRSDATVGVLTAAGALEGEPGVADRTPGAVAALGGSFYVVGPAEEDR